jgi:glycosyltransferase involved in cell wall biosynthesis
MPKLPTFSFYIPVYKKSPAVFERCLSSLCDMSMKDIEIICVFDGPDAELEAIAKSFKGVRSFVIEHGGAPKARNKGLSEARGKYVVAWDADCFAKPEMAKRWLQEFEATGADFVYTGYELTNERGGFTAEEFDPYSLTCGNYISTMSPILRSKAPLWEEDIQAAQDWNYWLTAVQNGCKGAFIPGSGFLTDPGTGGISAAGWSAEKRDETIRIIKERRGIPIREIGIYSQNYTHRALKLAKILGADYINPSGTGASPETYRMIINLGYTFLSRQEGTKNVATVQYWMPGEIAGLAVAQYPVVMETIRVAKGVLNLCNTHYEQNKLAELGITAEVVPLPLADEDVNNVQTNLPEKFSVLVVTDDSYGKLLREIQQDLPHITFGYGSGKAADYSCLLSFYTFASLDDAILVAHANGRNVISNVQAPFCGFVDPAQDWESFKKELYEKIREARALPFNKEAQEHYLGLTSPAKFRERILGYLSTKLEVV